MTDEESTVPGSPVVDAVDKWLTSIVIKLNLCPFAQREYRNQRIRFKETPALSEEQVLQDLVVEMSLLTRRPEIETTLLIIPHALQDFETYNQFLGFAESVISAMHLEGIYQIASFHPDYQFAGSQPEDVENYTNRAPYPILHLLREQSLETAIQAHPDTQKIPETNIRLMRQLGLEQMQSMLARCYKNEHAQD